jgi:hypothetical protein
MYSFLPININVFKGMAKLHCIIQHFQPLFTEKHRKTQKNTEKHNLKSRSQEFRSSGVRSSEYEENEIELV